ncbi:hypothetical protein G6011_11721 [Alternaria panax]|uniref:Uncharacterized protein n=1 Tax=Alternaria panax TaxID=48097 RepID=A0AAD4IDY4_9PLEO|nr:hypothetical protein G6011_11721 [Alternaria panax]
MPPSSGLTFAILILKLSGNVALADPRAAHLTSVNDADLIDVIIHGLKTGSVSRARLADILRVILEDVTAARQRSAVVEQEEGGGVGDGVYSAGDAGGDNAAGNAAHNSNQSRTHSSHTIEGPFIRESDIKWSTKEQTFLDDDDDKDEECVKRLKQEEEPNSDDLAYSAFSLDADSDTDAQTGASKRLKPWGPVRHSSRNQGRPRARVIFLVPNAHGTLWREPLNNVLPDLFTTGIIEESKRINNRHGYSQSSIYTCVLEDDYELGENGHFALAEDVPMVEDCVLGVESDGVAIWS